MKKIIALAVASAFVVPAAMAEVTVYGSLRTGLEVSRMEKASGDFDSFRLTDQNSRLGFKGTDKLDNGLTVLWNAESRIRAGSKNIDGTLRVSDKDEGWGARNTFVGLKGDFGTVKFGTKMADVIENLYGDFLSAGGDTNYTITGLNKFIRRGDAKPSSAVHYSSPSFGGFGFNAMYDFGSHAETANNEAARGYMADVFYKSKMFDVGVAYKYNDNTSANSVLTTIDNNPIAVGTYDEDMNYQNIVVGATVRPMAGLGITFGWQQEKNKNAAGQDQYSNGYGLSAMYSAGKMSYVLSAGMVDDLKGDRAVEDSGYWGVNGAVMYKLSKQTQLQAGVSYMDADDKAGGSATGSVGMTDTGVKAYAGQAAYAAMVGLRTDF